MNENDDVRQFIGFSFLDGIYWGFYASFFGFMSTYLLACGMNSSTVSIMIAGFMLLAFIGAFFWGGQCDKRQTNKKVFLVEFFVTVVLCMATFLMASINLLIAGVLYACLGFLAVPLGSNVDGWMLKQFHQSASVYGRARAIGSAGYAIVMLVCGQIINRIGYGVIPISSLILGTIVFVLACCMPEDQNATKIKILRPSKPNELLKYHSYVMLALILFFTGISVAPINNLMIVFLENVGGDVSTLGISSFVGVMVQAVFIFISGNLRKIPPYIRLILMCSCAITMTLLVYFATSPFMVILGTVFTNICYGLMLPTSRQLTDASVPQELRNTAYSTADAMYGSFAGVFALLYSGFLMDAFGAKFVALLGSFIMLVPLALSIFSFLKNRKTA